VRISVIYIFLFSGFLSFANQRKIDSLIQVVNNPETVDSTKAKILETLCTYYSGKHKGDSAKLFLEPLLDLAKREGLVRREAAVYNLYGNIHSDRGDYPQALEYYLKALKIWEQLGDALHKSMIRLNLANIYVREKSIDKALEIYNAIIEDEPNIPRKILVGSALGNSAVAYIDQKKFDAAQKRAEEAEAFYIKHGILNQLGSCYSILASIAKEKMNYTKAVEYEKKGLDHAIKFQSAILIAMGHANLGLTFTEMKQYEEAEKEVKEGLKLSRENYFNQNEMFCYQVLSKIMQETGRFKEAFQYFNTYVNMKDSIFNEEKSREMLEKEMTYEYDKKEALAKAELEKKETIARAESLRKNIFLSAVVIIALVILIFSVILSRRLKLTREQKVIIEEKNKEILDSINYAKRLQEAILPTKEMILSHLPETFIYYKPKDIVAGDFYFFEVVDNSIFIAAADCTGHGVPGAMVSVVCSNALTRCVKEFRMKDPAEILDKARELVLETFRKSGQDVKDGMDISLAVIEKNKVKWAGANNPLWYIQNGELKEVTPDKQSVGQNEISKPFTSHCIDLIKDDSFFLLTDGFADQFGGEKGKKFKYKQLKELLLSLLSLNPSEKEERLNIAFNRWRGSLDQVDDVCIIGIKLS
jgi:tetratricopeptide (TPR) repeat protein